MTHFFGISDALPGVGRAQKGAREGALAEKRQPQSVAKSDDRRDRWCFSKVTEV